MRSKIYRLTSEDERLIYNGSNLTDNHVYKFHQLVASLTPISPRETLLINHPQRIKPISRYEKHLQIIHCCTDDCEKCAGGHWICFFYDGESIFIYDSLNFKSLYENSERYIRALCPFFDEVEIFFPSVQLQDNLHDCGPFSMAFGTSIIFGEDPCAIIYRKEELRRHVSFMFHNDIIIPFPSSGMRVMANQAYTGSKPQIFPKLALRMIKTSTSRDIRVQPHLRERHHNIRGLPNADAVSCYANASLQSLLNCQDVRQVFSWNAESNAFRKAMLDYSANAYVRIKDVRLFAGALYGSPRQQDAGEFLSSLLNKSTSLQSTFKHLLFTNRKCAACDFVSPLQITPNYILLNSLSPNSNAGSLQEILDNNLDNWIETDIDCGRILSKEENVDIPRDENGVCLGKRRERVTLRSYTGVLIVQFLLFFTDICGNVSKITNFSLENISDDLVKVSGEMYRIDSVILHHGDTVERGHYTNLLRGDHAWTIADDNSITNNSSFSCNGSPYIVILKRIEVVERLATPEIVDYFEPQQLHQNNELTMKPSRTNVLQKIPANITSALNANHANSTRKRGSIAMSKSTQGNDRNSCLQWLSHNPFTGIKPNHIQLQISKDAETYTLIDNPKRFKSDGSPYSTEAVRPMKIINSRSETFHRDNTIHMDNIVIDPFADCTGRYPDSDTKKRKQSQIYSSDTGDVDQCKKMKHANLCKDSSTAQVHHLTNISSNVTIQPSQLSDNASYIPPLCTNANNVPHIQHGKSAMNRATRRKLTNKKYYLNNRCKILQSKCNYRIRKKLDIATQKAQENVMPLNHQKEKRKLHYKKKRESIRIGKKIRRRKAKTNLKRSAKIKAAKKISKKYRNLRRRLARSRKTHLPPESARKPSTKARRPSTKAYCVDFMKKTDILLRNKERYIDKIADQFNLSGAIPDRIQIDQTVTRSIHIRDAYIKELKKRLKNTQKKCELVVTKLGDVPISENINFAISTLCGKRGHHSTSDPFFLETAYNTDRFTKWQETDIDEDNWDLQEVESETCSNNKVGPQNDYNEREILAENEEILDTHWCEPLHDVFIINEKGQVTNVLPAIDKPGKCTKAWTCDDYCREVDVDVLKEVKDLFDDISQLSHKDVEYFISHLDTCTGHARQNGDAAGHPSICYVEPLSCKSKFLKLEVLSYHFPQLRTIERSIYDVKNSFQQIQAIGWALQSGNFAELRRICEEAKVIPVKTNAKNEEICLDENRLHETYSKGIKAFKVIDMDPPRIPCVSCERLCTSKYTTPVEKYLEPQVCEYLLGNEDENSTEPSYWQQLRSLYGPGEFETGFICDHCSKYLKVNRLPSLCILNNLQTDTVPEEIRTLNRFEKMLIQRAKAFQCVVKLETVQKKNIPHHMKLDQVKGRTFHLPLPLEATLEKLCKDTDPLNLNHELFVLVRSNPTKKGVIWEDYVDINKIWTALRWLKANNPLYKNIHLPGCSTDLLNQLQQVELEYREDSSELQHIDENANLKGPNDGQRVSVDTHTMMGQQIQSPAEIESVHDELVRDSVVPITVIEELQKHLHSISMMHGDPGEYIGKVQAEIKKSRR
ncbi:hypothetical protein QAD02_023857 [Eretmocerus hayati]|uniref:Uncharacterized protein n=1 Tax=Eretmocerus hayati TaxID=131215 RepID=A0ACC2Q0F9_9HYME|nr:hypothetical protein QAD02_023857 [Eretmocerus hayati]